MQLARLVNGRGYQELGPSDGITIRRAQSEGRPGLKVDGNERM